MSRAARQFARRAVAIQKSLGTRRAAGFLRNRNISLEEALFILVGRDMPA